MNLTQHNFQYMRRPKRPKKPLDMKSEKAWIDTHPHFRTFNNAKLHTALDFIRYYRWYCDRSYDWTHRSWVKMPAYYHEKRIPIFTYLA